MFIEGFYFVILLTHQYSSQKKNVCMESFNIFFSLQKESCIVDHLKKKLIFFYVTNIKMDNWSYSMLTRIISIRITY